MIPKISLSVFLICFLAVGSLCAQSDSDVMENALVIANKNQNKLEKVSQLLVVYNQKPDSFEAVLVVLEKQAGKWVVRQKTIEAGIGKKGFASQFEKIEGDAKSPTGIFRLGKLFSYEKQWNTLLENQQTTKEDKWIDDPNSEQYNTYVKGFTDAASYEKLLLKTDAYKYCLVIEYNTNPIVKGKGSAIFFHLGLKKPYFTAGCVAIDETNMKSIVDWLDPKKNPSIIMGSLADLKLGL
jgi:L,D-peptidoglycan transpeptidase YkuD (ErfK/YbiS/YcfS/YnhG family)